MTEFKNIHIGKLIKQRVVECDVRSSRICVFFNCDEIIINNMYVSASLEADVLLKWSKLLQYDFFRIYSQHLILYAPASASDYSKVKSTLPQFKKNIYTKGIVDFIIDLIVSPKKTKEDIIREYNIPKATLYRWLIKYNKGK